VLLKGAEKARAANSEIPTLRLKFCKMNILKPVVRTSSSIANYSMPNPSGFPGSSELGIGG
jgi:hypothetical protein